MKNLLFALLLLFVSCTDEKCEITYGTFNIRLINQGDTDNGLGWDIRKDRVAQFVLDADLDIVGMQEVLHPALLDLEECLLEYDHIGVGRDDGKEAGEYSCIWFKRNKYDVLDSGNFWLSETPDVPGVKGWDAACVRIATWGKLKDKKSGKVFMCVNTHFDHVGEVARRESALLIIRKIKEIVGNNPAIVTGDFNVNASSDAYKTITTNEFVLKDAYLECEDRDGVDYTWQNFSRLPMEEREKIDFIFVTPSISVKHVYIQEDYHEIPISDHNPHWADIEF